jgi:lipopolysaccharide/colanic/teichoic acid biosynthesis glycosyltransferase
MALARWGIRVDRFDEGVDSFGPGFARRTLDVTLSLFALVVLAVPMLIVAIAVRIDSRGPSFYRQRRIGQGGRSFSLIKFRTMVHGARGSLLTQPGDARVTRLGHFLRAVAIDELPQLLNILAGHMTLVGPRPQTPGFASSYPPELREVFAYRPGLVGPGVLRLNDDDVLPEDMDGVENWYLQNVIPARVQLDLEYLHSPTIRRTLGVIAETLVRVPRRLFANRSPENISVEASLESPHLETLEIALETNGGNGTHEEMTPTIVASLPRFSVRRVLALHDDQSGSVSLNGVEDSAREEGEGQREDAATLPQGGLRG